MDSGALKHILRACEIAEHFEVPPNTRQQIAKSKKLMKITMGRKSNLEFLGNSCLVFLRGRGIVECYGKNNEFYIHKDDANMLTVISRDASNKESSRYNLPDFDVIQPPQSRQTRSAVQQSHPNQSRRDESKPLLDKETSTKLAISPQTTAATTRATTASEQRTVKIPVLPASPNTQDDWNVVVFMGLGFGGMEYRSYCLYFS